MKKENDILEETLAMAENGYAAAYAFLLEEYKRHPESCGPQTLYFLACLAGGANLPEKALQWLRKAIADNGWWYRPEVLEDEDLAVLNSHPDFLSLKALSDTRYKETLAGTKAVFSWEGKKADSLFLAVHGNTQNGLMARTDWEPLFRGNAQWQLETIQSAEPDGYGTFRWSYDMASYVPVADAIQKMQAEGYQKLVCGGFSAGCDMLLRAITFSSASCDLLVLQSPWIPMLKDHQAALENAVRQKNIPLKIFCGSDDEDCLPVAKRLHEAMTEAGVPVDLVIQAGTRHQFSGASYASMNFL